MKNVFTILLLLLLGTGFMRIAEGQDLAPQIDQLRSNLRTNPEDIASRLQLINLLFLNKDYREVIDVTYRAIETMPTRSSLYYFAGESFRRLGNYDSAFAMLSKGYSIRPYTDLSESFGMVLVHLKKTDDAAKILRTVSAEKPTFLDDHYKAGMRAYDQGKMQEATEELLAVYLIDKTRLTREQALFVQFNENFESYVSTNNSEAAVTAFTMTLKARFPGDYDFSSISQAFKCLLEQKRVEEARGLFEDFNKMPSNNIDQRTIDVKFLSVAHDLVLRCPQLKDSSKSVFRRIAKESFGLDDAALAQLYSLYDFMLTQGATQLASELTDRVVKGSTGLQDPFLRLTDIFVLSNRVNEAAQSITSFFIASKLDELGYTKEFVQSFKGLFAQKRTDEVNDILKQLNVLNPRDLVTTYITLGDFFMKMGNGERAVSILNKVVAIDPGNHVASVKLGGAYYTAGRYDDIIRFLGSTTDPEGLRYLALAYEKKMALTEANKAWQSIIAGVQDTAKISEANEHIRQNTITMMSPQYQQLKAQAAAATSPVQLAIVKPAGAVEDNTRGIALVTSDVPSVTFEGYAGSNSPIDTIMVNGAMVRGEAATPDEITASKLSTPYVVKFSTSLTLPAAQKSEVEVSTTDSLGNRAVRKYVVDVQAQRAYTGGLPTIRAFVVGISEYSDKSLNLKYAEEDANLFYQRMRDPTTIGIPAANMVLLTNSAATRAGILEGLERLLSSSFENDVVIIYFAMHGVSEEDLLYFVPYDARISSLRTTAISGLDMDYLIKTKGAKRKVLMFVDACHSGGAGSSLVFGGTRAVAALPILLAEMAKSQPGLAVFSASDKGQVSREGEEWGGHGVFTYYLLKAITTPAANTNADQFIQLREIVDYVRDKVASDTKGKQTPVFKCFSCDPDMPLFYSK